MKVTSDIKLRDFEAWSGARDTLEALIKHDKCEEVEDFIEDCIPEATATEVNDFLWFEDEYIATDILGMTIDEFYN